MADVSLFIGGIRPLPESGRPTGMYKQPASGRLELGREGFIGDEQADRRVHGGPEKAVHLYPARHYARLAERFPDAAPQLVIGSLGENISTAELDESDVRIGDIWHLGSAELQVCQPRNPCWKIDERFASDGMAAFIAEHRLTGWYWRVVTPGHVIPGDRLELVQAAEGSFTLGEAMLCWQAHRPALADLEILAGSPGIAKNWQQKIVSRVEWLRKNPEKTSPAPVAFHVKPENP
ncbi:MAG: MOSC domain-containing protein [Gammaproteobacteria bacterium]|nr:MOSC domain-containing protein [Gammaproteobacteria bacterium]MBU1600433.1 MOSC domain-containing protein [Gammaproteobacteria bacterium]MBU2434889.1 MOSC domain-containing protein [Gammaproteobacteria bacterium]MBU2448125.1 MOSC domain-containing protein [Gammaproteobacteria bacterium]